MKKDPLDTINDKFGHIGEFVYEQYLYDSSAEIIDEKEAEELNDRRGVKDLAMKDILGLKRSLNPSSPLYPFGQNDFGPCILPRELHMPGYKGKKGESSSESPRRPNERNTGDDYEL